MKEEEKEVEGINSKIFQRVDGALKIIDAHEWLRNAKEADAIGLPTHAMQQDRGKKGGTKRKCTQSDPPPQEQLSGTQAAYETEAFQQAMATGGTIVVQATTFGSTPISPWWPMCPSA